jgi:xylose dehydrogenase (NAD/NADP)
MATQRPGLEVDDGANIQLIFPDGRIAQITVGFDTWHSQEFNILGTKGSLEADLVWNNENKPVRLKYNSKNKTDLFHFAPVNQLTLQLEHMYDVLDGKTDHRIPALDSINQMRTIDATYESFETRRAVPI